MKSEAYVPSALPAPWHLRGRGYVFLYRFSPAFIQQQGLIPKHLQAHFTGGFGTMMLVDYDKADCGPYRELLFIPGSFRYQGPNRPSISRIFVSSESSVIHGRRNWGIPKDLADFQVTSEADGSESWRVLFQGREVFAARIKAGVIPIPMHSALAPHTLMQSWENQIYYTKLSARGYGRRAKIIDIRGDGVNFPDLSSQKVFLGMGLKIDRFAMTFHEAVIKPEVKA